MKKLLILLVLVCATAACSNYQPPKKQHFNNKQVIDKPFDKVWSSMVDYIVETAMPCNTISKDNGLIVCSGISLKGRLNAVDCGCIEKATNQYDTSQYGGIYNIVGDVYISIQPKGSEQTTVLIKTLFQADFDYNPSADDKVMPHCISTGKMEKEIFNFLKN